ncbi:MAG: c-type cytochrome, partial [Bacteroidota bacterium]
MKRLILAFICISFFIVACGNAGSGGGETTAPSASDLADGKKIYKKYCVACHGADGQMQLNGAKNFTESTM